MKTFSEFLIEQTPPPGPGGLGSPASLPPGGPGPGLGGGLPPPPMGGMGPPPLGGMGPGLGGPPMGGMGQPQQQQAIKIDSPDVWKILEKLLGDEKRLEKHP